MSVKRYDIESFLSDVSGFLQSNLNTQILAMNSEKNDSLTLAQISSSAYFLQTLNEQVAAYDPFIFYGVQDVKTEGAGPTSRKAYTVNVIVVLSDQGQDSLIAKRLFRYGRVLEDLFEKNWASLGSSVKIKVQSLVPVSFRLANSSDFHRAVGVALDFTLN